MAPNLHKLYLLFLLPLIFSCTEINEEKNGFVTVEAEAFDGQTKDNVRSWYIISREDKSALETSGFEAHYLGASGNAYIKILPDTRITHDDELKPGVNFSEVPGDMAVVSYKVKFNSPGKYYVWVRAYSSGSEDNGLHVGINGTWPESGKRMQWCDGKNQWTWDSKQRTQEVHCGVPELIYLEVPEAGVHTITFSMREDGFEFDKWAMSKDYINPEMR